MRDSRVEKHLWTAILLASFFMPLAMLAGGTPVPELTLTVSTGSTAASVLATARLPTVSTTLVVVYLLVSAVLLARFLLTFATASRIRRGAIPLVDSRFAGLDVRVSAAMDSPATFGATVLLPADYLSWPPTTLSVVLAHEQAHVRARDGLRQWFAAVNQAIFWFNPCAWLLRRRLALLAELTSDQAALELLPDTVAYAGLLVALAGRGKPVAAAAGMSGRSSLTQRIPRILENRLKQPMTQTRKIVLTTATALAIGSTSLLGVAPVAAPAAATTPVPAPGTGAGPMLLPEDDTSVKWLGGSPLEQFYPKVAKRHAIQGVVKCQLTLNAAGQVIESRVLEESPGGYELGEAAVKATRTFRFSNPHSKPVKLNIRVTFALAD